MGDKFTTEVKHMVEKFGMETGFIREQLSDLKGEMRHRAKARDLAAADHAMTPRLVEPPLGADADERPSREEVAAAFAEAWRRPVPDYPRLALMNLLPRRGRGH
jgi:hypothetical protein